jgi:acetolactate synthase I/II/III large subunit
MTLHTGAQLLVSNLVLHGVRRAFCVPGESYLGVLDALYDVREQLELIVNRHEGGACLMAEAHGKLTGEPGICFVTRAPGATNAAIGVHQAMQDSTALILFIGQVGNDFVEREAFQELDYRRMFAPMCKWVAQIDRADRVAEYVARAFQVATSGRPGPVVLALPEDMLAQVVAFEPCPLGKAQAAGSKSLQRYTAIQAAPSADDMQRLHARLSRAHNPFVILGGAGWTQAAARQMQGFLETWQLPFGGAFRFCDVIDNGHPQYAGDVGIGINPKLAARVKAADVLLTIGARLGEMTTSGYTLIDSPRPQQALIHLYNQADDLGRVYQGELMIATGMPQAAAALAALSAPAHSASATLAWAGTAQQAHAELLAWQAEPALMAREQPAVNQWQVVQTLKKLAPADTIITNGAGNFATWANRYWPYQGLASCGHRTQIAPSSGSMGVGIPAAVAAKLEHPAATVVCFAGDGDALMTGQELATASQYGVGIVVLVFNNGMYGTIRMHQEKHFSARVHGTALVNPDFVQLVGAYGGRGWLVDKTAQFEPALSQALVYAASAKRPALIELIVDPNIITPGATISGMRAAA